MFYTPKNDRGMTLVELILALGVFSMICVVSAVFLQVTMASRIQASSRRDILDNTALLRASVNRKSANGNNCSTVIAFPSGVLFNPNGETPVILTVPPEQLMDGAFMKGSAGFRIDKVYLQNASMIDSSTSEKSYVVHLYMEPSLKSGDSTGTWKPMRRREITTVSVVTDNSGQFLRCNLKAEVVNPEITCSSMKGMIWNPVSQTCLQDIPFSTTCSGSATPDAAGNCVPAPSKCKDGEIAQDFDHGVVTSCAGPPTAYDLVDPSKPDVPIVIPPPSGCTCGRAKIALDSWCATCDKDTPTLRFLNGVSYQYIIMKCDPTSGNLIYQSLKSTSSEPSICDSQLRPASCDGSGNGCTQI